MKLVIPAALAALLLMPALSRAEMSNAEKITLACMGWAGDRILLSTVGQKHREMAAALDDIDPKNPSKPLARAMVESLNLIDTHVRDAQTTSSDAFRSICSP